MNKYKINNNKHLEVEKLSTLYSRTIQALTKLFINPYLHRERKKQASYDSTKHQIINK